MAHDLFGPEVRDIVQRKDYPAMEAFCEVLHPATVAEALEGELEPTGVWDFIRHVSPENQTAIFSYLGHETQESLVAAAAPQQMARIIETMSHDDRADLLRRLDPKVGESLLRLIDEADRKDIASLTRYGENTVGALMTTDYAWLPENLTVEEALERLRLQAPNKETIYYIYIVDDQRRIVGVVTLRNLILAKRQTLISDIMETRIVTVNADDEREQVARELARYDLIALPVVDNDKRLVGIVTHDDVIDVVVDEATADAHRMGAVDPLKDDYLETSFTTMWQKRAIWLSCLFGAELLTFTALASFEDSIAKVVVLSLFVPLCISTGGNSGSQAATLITRAMALGQVRIDNWFKVLRQEIWMGLALGLTLGLIAFVRGFLTPEDVRAATPPRHDAFTINLPAGSTELAMAKNGHIILPPGCRQTITPKADDVHHLKLPEHATMPAPVPLDNGEIQYQFPAGCTFPREAVRAADLALVVAISVALICLWGTIVGAMLPLVFQRFGVDPGIASSPFVATAVDVTGIVIFFSTANWILGPFMAQ